ncbi:MAG TPA: Uma2 family endonuclease [Kofleriaceae bacterium]
MVAPDPEWLEQRRRLDQDRLDEVWDGVLHMVPFASSKHQEREFELASVLRPLALVRGWRMLCNYGVQDPATTGYTNFRVPDVVVFDPKYLSERGIEGRAEIVVELLSPRDESREKLPFYAKCQVQEVWLLHPITRAIEVFVLRGGTYFPVVTNEAGEILAPALGLELRVVAGPKLRIAWADGSAEI